MKQLTFGLRLGRGPLSRLIRYFTIGPYSHVDVLGPDGRWWGARSDKCGGEPRGFWPRPADYDPDPVQLFTIRVTSEQHAYFWFRLYSLKTLPYDWVALVAMGFPRIARLLKRWRRGVFCSDAQTLCCRYARIFGKMFEKADTVTPTEFALMLCARGAKISKVIENYGKSTN